MMADKLPPLAQAGPRVLRTDAEYDHYQAIRRSGFTPWYVGNAKASSLLEGRAALNALAAVFPEFYHQARTAQGQAAGYLVTVPGYWGGGTQALPDFHHFHHNLTPGRKRLLALTLAHQAAQWLPGTQRGFDLLAAQLRQERLHNANCIVLLAMTVDPQYKGMNLPLMFFGAVRRAAVALGMRHVIGPFRPSGYGGFKALRRLTHTTELFYEYCAQRNEEGLPLDPWLRTLARNGARFLRPEPRSFRLERPLERFEQFRLSFKPEAWYSPEPDVWECGETPTWYVDRSRGIATSVEPNLWGSLSLDGPAAA